MTTSPYTSQSAFDGSRMRVILLVDLHEGAQQEFLDAYEYMRDRVASVPGHLGDQLCQSLENPSQWVITSEWATAPPYLAWVNSEEHLETVKPLQSCVRELRSMRYGVVRETGRARPDAGGLQTAVRVGDGVTRHALTFTVKPGSESKVTEILAGYAPPQARVDDSTRLRRTTLFIHGNRVVRTVEVEGDLMAALRHVSRQPEVRAVEEALNPHLEQHRDLSDPESARAFFARAAMPAVHHVARGGPDPDGLTRHALYYPARAGCGDLSDPESARAFFARAAMPAVHHVARGGPDPDGLTRHALYYPARAGCGMALARLLSRQDETAAADPAGPVHRSTVFQREDIVVRLIDVRGDPETDPVRALGIHGPRKAAVLARLLDGDALGVAGVPTGEREATRLLAHAEMALITDRRAAQP
ncbi:SchA/CurD-like domain-containing protein [Streptomyces sp. T21Q-yed]|uniref:SchA/CurD-like domain-containing protein n=1 Tax=Streptomyces sp. T21Q-yed TaxID=3018441 RepID=UPI0023DF4126|nr:SchA/CurD-like domain-containing protein [Streptomyces sp. T21Q-yed]MDF3148611.1 SchA/CurD-like domain-containing protein [Streptomyces sp. T21Q-yed]